MAVAQGAKKTLAYKAQSAQGTAATGTGGQLLRRRTSAIRAERATYQNDEITSHRQSTGATAGVKGASIPYRGLLSPRTFQDIFAAALMKAWAATSNITGLSLTIAASGSNYTITRGSGDFLTGGIKKYDVIRITAGTFAAANLDKNLLVLGVTATVLTVRAVNGSALTAEGPVGSATIAVPGKKLWVPTSGHTDVWFTFEEWYSDLSKSERSVDTKPGQIQIGLPATGNATCDIDFVALQRTRDTSQSLTSPSAETTTRVLQAVNGLIVVNGVVTPLTGGQITINPGNAPGEDETGTNVRSSMAQGDVAVSGQFSAKFTDTLLQDAYDDQSDIDLVLMASTSGEDDADFMTFVLNSLNLFGDEPDDGKKEIIRTYPFTAKIPETGGASLANHQTIISIQDSQANA